MDLFCDSFEAGLRNDSIEMKLILIPESVVLHSSTLLFKSSENTVYVVNSSSLSKHIPWKSLKLVIEYEYEYDRSHWEEICTQQNIPHVFVKVSDLPLKTLEEIRKLPFKESNKRQEKHLILSSYVASQCQLLYILETKLNASICIRQYKELLPHMHFADIVVDEISAVILVSEVLFYNEDFSSILYDRIAFLYLKYEACWIIIQGKDKNVKMKDTKLQSTENTFWNFFLNCKDFSEISKNFKIKILHANSIEETGDLIKCISAFGSRLKANVMEEPKLSVPNQVSQDELFLLSFPCLNPYVVHIILSEYSLGTFINLDFDECCKKLHTVPGRFLKCFYSTLNKLVAPNQRETSLSQFQNSSLESPELSQGLDNFELVPSLVRNTEDFHLPSVFPKQCNFTSTVDKSIGEILETGSQQNSWPSSPSIKSVRKPDLTLEEIDLDYMALKLGDKYDRYSPSENEYISSRNSSLSHSSNSFTLSPKEDIEGRDPQVIPDLTDDVRPNVHSSLFNPEELKKRSVNSPLSELPEMGLSSDIFQMNNELDSEIFSSGRKKLYFDPKPYFFTPKKRKYSSDSTESSSGSPSSHSKRSCRIQKGVSSKTVTKQDFMYSAPSLNHQEITPFSSEVQKDLPSWPVVKRSNADVRNYFHRKTEKLRRESEFFNNSPISSQNYISSPPMSQSSMLGLVKVPGNGGQTELRFM